MAQGIYSGSLYSTCTLVGNGLYKFAGILYEINIPALILAPYQLNNLLGCHASGHSRWIGVNDSTVFADYHVKLLLDGLGNYRAGGRTFPELYKLRINGSGHIR